MQPGKKTARRSLLRTGLALLRGRGYSATPAPWMGAPSVGQEEATWSNSLTLVHTDRTARCWLLVSFLREGETIEGSRTMRNRPNQVLHIEELKSSKFFFDSARCRCANVHAAPAQPVPVYNARGSGDRSAGCRAYQRLAATHPWITTPCHLEAATCQRAGI